MTAAEQDELCRRLSNTNTPIIDRVPRFVDDSSPFSRGLSRERPLSGRDLERGSRPITKETNRTLRSRIGDDSVAEETASKRGHLDYRDSLPLVSPYVRAVLGMDCVFC